MTDEEEKEKKARKKRDKAKRDKESKKRRQSNSFEDALKGGERLRVARFLGGFGLIVYSHFATIRLLDSYCFKWRYVNVWRFI